MPNWINDNKIYKPVYALFCLIASAVVAVIAGFDYRLSWLNQSESVNSSYGELFVALVLAISGIIVLASRKVHLHMIVCFILVITQVTAFFFCRKLGTTERVSAIKWIPLVTAVFTMLLFEPKKKKSDSIDMDKSNTSSLFKKIIVLVSGVVLAISGICAH